MSHQEAMIAIKPMHMVEKRQLFYSSMSDQLEEGELSEPDEEAVVSSSSDEEWHLQGSLPVAPMNDSFDPNAEPASGEEYLRLVRYGAWQLPSAMRAKEKQLASVAPPVQDPIDELDMQLNAGVPPTPVHLLPLGEFIDSFIKSFLEGCPPPQDEHVCEPSTKDDYPLLGHEGEWRALLYPEENGKAETHPIGSIEEEVVVKDINCGSLGEGSLTHSTRPDGERLPKRPRRRSIGPDDLHRHPPSQRQLMQLIRYHHRWIASSEPRTITLRQYQFVVRLLQVLDARITPWQVSCLRDLAMLMIRIRSERAPAGDTKDYDKHHVLFCTNGIIVAIAKRFGQADLLTR